MDSDQIFQINNEARSLKAREISYNQVRQLNYIHLNLTNQAQTTAHFTSQSTHVAQIRDSFNTGQIESFHDRNNGRRL